MDSFPSIADRLSWGDSDGRGTTLAYTDFGSTISAGHRPAWRRAGLFLQYECRLCFARHSGKARRALAMGSTRGNRRYSSRNIPRIEIAGRGPAGSRRKLSAGIVRLAE